MHKYYIFSYITIIYIIIFIVNIIIHYLLYFQTTTSIDLSKAKFEKARLGSEGGNFNTTCFTCKILISIAFLF